jgi:transcriptional regulator with XRE-family HTH domain
MSKAPTMVRGTPDRALGAAIRQAREEAGLSQAELAVHAGLAVGTVARLESEKSSDPSWSSVRAMARVLGLSMEQLGALVDAEERG